MIRHWPLAVLAGLAIVLLFLGLGSVPLTDRDEGANAEAAREMLERGAWITPTLNYAPRFAKPAMVYWLTAAAYAALGATETAARLPSAVATAAVVALQLAFARWALGPAAAFRASLVLLLTIEVVALGRMALTDATLVLCTTAAGYAFFRAHHGPAPVGRWYATSYAALGLGMLVKGPVGVLVPVVAIAGYLTIAGGWRRVWREGRPAWGLVLLLVVGAPWYVVMLWRHGADYLARAEGETLGRVFRTVTGPGGTVLFYVPVVLLGAFPWSALLPAALLGVLKGARARIVSGRAGAAAVFAAVWIVAVLSFFSVIQSRLPHYVAPLFPAAALLLAATWPARVSSGTRLLLAGLGALAGGGLIAAGLLEAGLTPMVALAYPVGPEATLPRSIIGVGLIALAAGSAGALRDGDRLFAVLAALTVVLIAAGLHVALPAFGQTFVAPAGQLVRQAADLAGPCDELVVLGPYRPSLVFYARRPLSFAGLRDRARLDRLALRPGRLFVLAPEALLNGVPPSWASLRRLDGRGGYVLLASPASSPCP